MVVVYVVQEFVWNTHVVVLVVGVVVVEVVAGLTIEVVHQVDLVEVAVVVDMEAVEVVAVMEAADVDQDRDPMTEVVAAEEEEEEVEDRDQDLEVDQETDLAVVTLIAVDPAQDPDLLPSQEMNVRHPPGIEDHEAVPTSLDQSRSPDLSRDRDRDHLWKMVKTRVAIEVTAIINYQDGLHVSEAFCY